MLLRAFSSSIAKVKLTLHGRAVLFCVVFVSIYGLSWENVCVCVSMLSTNDGRHLLWESKSSCCHLIPQNNLNQLMVCRHAYICTYIYA